MYDWSCNVCEWIERNFIKIVFAFALIAIVVGVLAGCAETGPHTGATDWRSIHQRSPDTGS